MLAPAPSAPGTTDGIDDVIRWLRAEVAGPARGVPLPGSGRTLARWRYLAAVAADDLVHARLVEGHLDALAILAELGRPDAAEPGRIHAVWAADPTDLTATDDGDGFRLTGTKRYCSGSTNVDAALVTATAADGPRLFLLGPPDLAAIDVVEDSWPSVGMAATASVTLRFDLRVGVDSAVGEPGTYVDRRGFWAGGAGVAVCWWGGATAVVDRLAGDPFLTDDRGAARAVVTARARLDAAAALARETAGVIDDPAAGTDAVRAAALALRVAVGDAGRSALVTNQEVAGTRLQCLDPTHSRRVADLGAYLTQLGLDTAREHLAARPTRGRL